MSVGQPFVTLGGDPPGSEHLVALFPGLIKLRELASERTARFTVPLASQHSQASLDFLRCLYSQQLLALAEVVALHPVGPSPVVKNISGF